VFAILEKTQILGNSSTNKNVKGINAVIAIAIGLLALLNNYVATFFATLFPRFGVVLAVFVVLLILIGFFYKPDPQGKNSLTWIGWVLGIGVVLWAWSEWDSFFGGTYQFGAFFRENISGIILVALIGWLIYLFTKNDSGSGGKTGGG
jgi:hypothetical protein